MGIKKKFQGAMIVESKDLDNAFAGADESPRQRLISAEIDYHIGTPVNCATLTYADPDARLSSILKIGSTQTPNSIVYNTWTVYIGYAEQSKEEMTKFTGFAQMESPNYPEEGPPEIKISIFDPVAMMKKSVTPKGCMNYWRETTDSETPIQDAIREIAKTYDAVPMISDGVLALIEDVEDLLNHESRTACRVDVEGWEDWAQSKQSAGQFPMPDMASWASGDSGDRVWGGPTQITAPLIQDFCRGAGRGDPAGLVTGGGHSWETDFQYMDRIRGRIEALAKKVAAYKEQSFKVMSEDTVNRYARFLDAFGVSPQEPGKVSNQQLSVIFGLSQGKLYLCFAMDFFTHAGYDGIPYLEYRRGNHAIRSANFTVKSGESQTGFLAWVTSITRKAEESIELQSEEPIEKRVSGDINALRPLLAVTSAALLGDEASLYGDDEEALLQRLKEELSTDIKGDIQTFGIPKLRAAQLVALDGFGFGPGQEVKGENFNPENRARYSRVYLINQCTHRMDETGFYSVSLEVEGCSMDNSSSVLEVILAEMIKMVSKEGGKTFWQMLLGR